MTTMPANPTPAEGVVVPVEPTPEMVEAGWRAKGGSHEGRPVWKCTVDVQVALIYLAMLAARPAAPTQSAAQTGEACRCSRCVNEAVAAEGGSGFDTRLMQMFLCTQCGNKRCPHATDHRLSCTNSNEAGQEGSSYGPPLYRRDQATLIEAQAAEIEGLRKAVEEAVTAAMWSEKALERYDNALGLDVDEAALIALSKCKDFVERYDTHRTTQEGPNP